jgi:hypothetical protein
MPSWDAAAPVRPGSGDLEHGGLARRRLDPEVSGLGSRTATVALPSGGTDPAARGPVADGAAAVGATVADFAGDVVAVGHSYGGVVITEAYFDSRDRHLVSEKCCRHIHHFCRDRRPWTHRSVTCHTDVERAVMELVKSRSTYPFGLRRRRAPPHGAVAEKRP